MLGFALLGSAALGAGLSLLLERRDTGFRLEDELHEATDCPCLGLVGTMPGADQALNTTARREAVRAIAASIGLTAFNAPSKVVLVTSALPGEGKSALVDALALSLVEMGRRVLIMDATPRSEPEPSMRPALEDMIGDMASRRQFLNSRHAEPFPVAQRRNAILQSNLPTTYTGRHMQALSIIQRRTGLSDGAGLFITSAMEEWVKDACTKFDVIIVEAPPVLLVADALVLAQVADVVVQAVRWHETTKGDVAAAMKRFRDASVRLHGTVLTGVDMNRYASYKTLSNRNTEKNYIKYYQKIS